LLNRKQFLHSVDPREERKEEEETAALTSQSAKTDVGLICESLKPEAAEPRVAAAKDPRRLDERTDE
jgi:hypothetical protein